MRVLVVLGSAFVEPAYPTQVKLFWKSTSGKKIVNDAARMIIRKGLSAWPTDAQVTQVLPSTFSTPADRAQFHK